MRAPELTVGVLRGKGLLDPRTGLPCRALLIDRLDLALTRVRTHGTLVSLVLVPGDADVAVQLRQTMRDDHTVAQYEPDLVAIVAEHPHGDAKPIVERVRAVTTARTGWYTSDGNARVHEVLFRAEAALI
jgi:GGDEF domain-containing protein